MGKKLTIEEVKLQAKELGKWIVLDDHYEGACVKLKCKCVKCGYKTKFAWQRIRRNVKCKKCNKASRLEFIRAEFAKEEYILLTRVYDNSGQKLEYKCPVGHYHSITWGGWNSKEKYRCPYCNGNAVLTIEFVRSEFAKEGYILLTKVYKNAHQKLEYICKRGHCHSIRWGDWNSSKKVRCPYCANTAKLKIEFIRAAFEKEGYILLTEVYENAHQKLEYICPRGHRGFVSWANWNQSVRCPCFSNMMKPTIESIRADFAKEGYELLTKIYKNNKQKLKYRCPIGHIHYVTWTNWNSKEKRRCPKCNDGVSQWEKTVKEFFTKLNIDYESNDRTQLTNPNTNRNLELDIWFPKLNKAIECNGLYWHSKSERKECDKIKKQLCKDQGINLLVITDKEWNDDIDKCKAKLILFVKNEAKHVA
jgi:hypothetical protein